MRRARDEAEAALRAERERTAQLAQRQAELTAQVRGGGGCNAGGGGGVAVHVEDGVMKSRVDLSGAVHCLMYGSFGRLVQCACKAWSGGLALLL